MTEAWQLLIIGGMVITSLGFALIAFALYRLSKPKKLEKNHLQPAVEDVQHFFDDDFRAELRNQGRLHFQKIINDNAMFLKHDLDATIAQLNDYLNKEINLRLDTEFASYGKAMKDAQELALDSLNKSAEAIKQQHLSLAQQLEKDVTERTNSLVTAYEDNMAKITERYILEAMGDQFDVKSQLPGIIAKMEESKDDIVKDMRL